MKLRDGFAWLLYESPAAPGSSILSLASGRGGRPVAKLGTLNLQRAEPIVPVADRVGHERLQIIH